MSDELQEVIDSNPEWYKELLYKEVKVFIKDNINNATRSFIAIGYYLKHIRDNAMYTEDGYENIWELAQSEFGISKSQASKFMSINDKFSKDGNSPILQDQYNDFSCSKLSEMLYLTDEQLTQVTEGTTVVQIREIKNLEKSVSTSKQEFKQCKFGGGKCDLWTNPNLCSVKARCQRNFIVDLEPEVAPAQVEPDISDKEKWLTRCEVLKDMCNSICKMSSYVLEKNDYSMKSIQSVSRGDIDFSFGFGDDGTGHSKYDAKYKAKTNQYRVEEFHGDSKWMFEAGEVDQDIYNFYGRNWHNKQREANKQPEIVNDTTESENDISDIPERGCSNCNYNDMTPDEFSIIDPGGGLPCNTCDDKMCYWTPKIEPLANDMDTETGLPCDICGYDVQGCCDYNTADDYCISGDKWKPREVEPVETVEAEIIQTEPEKVVHEYSPQFFLNEQKRKLSDMIAVEKVPEIILQRQKTIVCALASMVCDLENVALEKDETVQPELPILKNNDQRQEWLNNYREWGIWYKDEHINVTYYRFSFIDGAYIIVDEFVSWDIYNRKNRTSAYYHLVGKVFNSQGDKTRYSHYDTSVTELVEYLKDIQKKK